MGLDYVPTQANFVLVDVSGFYVSYFRDEEPVWTSKVIVGRPYRETPIFKSTITYVVFNPTWTIPSGILVKDKLPVIKRDPGYLKRDNIRVIDSSGREVNPYSVNWSRYRAGRLPPYTLRQDPGDDNALGLVKIMFPNKYSVYLHDTPSKSLFDKDERPFSSGCIRVQKEFELAELVLNEPARCSSHILIGCTTSPALAYSALLPSEREPQRSPPSCLPFGSARRPSIGCGSSRSVKRPRPRLQRLI